MQRDTPEPDIQIQPCAHTEGAFACVDGACPAIAHTGGHDAQTECAAPGEPGAAPLAQIREGIIAEAAKAQAKRARVSLLLEYLLFMMIPVAGIVIAAIWATSGKGDALRRNLAHAMFIANVIMLALYLLMALALAPYFTAWLYDEWQETLFWQEDERWEQPPQNSRAPEGATLTLWAHGYCMLF